MVGGSGSVVCEAKVVSDPVSLIGWFAYLEQQPSRIGLEASPLSHWLCAGLKEAGLVVELLEARHVHAAFKAMAVKTDRKDACGIAQLTRFGWFRAVHCKSLATQETRAPLAARTLVHTKRHDVEMSLRGLLRGFGLKVGKTTPRRFEARVALDRAFRKLEARLREQARVDERVRLWITTPSVGVLTALTFVSAIDHPGRFKSLRQVSAHIGLTPKRYQSAETDVSGRISKAGDHSVRTLLYEAANVILTRPVKGSGLKSWAVRLAKRAGQRKAKVALARKLAVILHRMLVDRTVFDASLAARA